MMRSARNPARRRVRRGFTLVEAISTILVLSVVASVSSGIIVEATDGYVEASTRAQLQAEMSTALDRCVREIRNIPLDARASGVAPDVDSLFPTYVEWTGNNRISYSAGTLLLKLNGGTARTLLPNVTAFDVTAFDEKDTQLAFMLAGASCDPIRRVRLTLTAERYGVTVTLRTRVYLRCAMTRAKA